MSINGIGNKIRQAGFYIPFTFYFVVFALLSTVAYKILKTNLDENGTAFVDIFLLLLKVAVWFGAIVIALSFLSVLLSYVYFLWKEKKSFTFNVTTDHHETNINQKQPVKVFIKPVLKPIFGFVKLRLQYDENRYSQKFSLIENTQRKLFSNTIEGTYYWPLPQIKEYHIHKAILYFEDVFQFFSIAVDLSARNQFFTQPSANDLEPSRVSPRKTEETTTRIEELRKVEGEYLNYKNFENNDDVRRIVWKIYAKNKELVVRIPEILDPYASHVYLYPSFFSTFSIAGNIAVEIPFLNYYKVMVWSLYQSLVKKGFDVRYIPDQETIGSNKGDIQQWVKYIVSTSNWQQNKDLRSFVKPRDASVVVISSLNDISQVQELVENQSNGIKFVFVKLSDSLKKQNVLDWVQWLFVQQRRDDIEVYKRAWMFSSQRAKIIANENKLQELLAKYEIEVAR